MSWEYSHTLHHHCWDIPSCEVRARPFLFVMDSGVQWTCPNQMNCYRICALPWSSLLPWLCMNSRLTGNWKHDSSIISSPSPTFGCMNFPWIFPIISQSFNLRNMTCPNNVFFLNILRDSLHELVRGGLAGTSLGSWESLGELWSYLKALHMQC